MPDPRSTGVLEALVAESLLPTPSVQPDAASLAARAALDRAQAGELLGPTDIAAIWKISTGQFYRLNRAGAFDHLKTQPPIGPKCFSGIKVYRHVQGEVVYEPTFGRRRGVR